VRWDSWPNKLAEGTPILNTAGDREGWRSGAAFGAVCAVMVSLAASSVAAAASKEIRIPGDHTFPESITGTSDGTLYIGSLGDGAVFRVPPRGSTAQQFIARGASDLMSVIGVLADENSGTLWVCSSDFSAVGITVPTGKQPTALRAFDLKTGAAKGSVPLPGAKHFCQDIAIGKDGSTYVTDQLNPTILRLKSGATSFEVWAKDDRFGGEGYNLDGICFGSDGSLYVNTTLRTGCFASTLAPTAAPAPLPNSSRRGHWSIPTACGCSRASAIPF